MNIKVGILILILVAVIFFAVDSLFRHRLPWQPSFEVGQCYEMINSDPFEKDVIRMKVIDLKKGYIQYYYLYDDGKVVMLHSSSAKLLSSIYRKIPCQETENEDIMKNLILGKSEEKWILPALNF